jgi:amino acid adenylation domain-containing protein
MTRPGLLAMFAESLEKFKDKTAVEWMETRLTYQELGARSDSVAHRLISVGARKGALVVVVLENSMDVIPVLLGILKAGCVFVPLDHNNPEKRLEAMLSLITPEFFVTAPQFVAPLQRLVPTADLRRNVLTVAGGVISAPAGTSAADAATMTAALAERADASGPDDMCYLYFTSGSTGQPKAIAGRPKSVAHFIDWEIRTFGVDEMSRVSQLTHPAFDAFLRDIFVPLCAGGTICIPEDREAIMDGPRLARWIDERAVTLIHCVPSLFRMIADQGLRPEHFARLKHIMLAGEQLFPADVKKWMDIFGERVQLVNFYGATESTMIKFFYPIKRADTERKFIPVGKPMEGARALVLGADGKACPPGSVGEIYIRTPYLSLGYYNQPELTREVFVQNPFSDDPQDLVYKTGDLGRLLADGNFEFLGRKDFQVKVRGVRVELGEIENLLRHLEGVKDVVVVEARGAREEPFLCAYVVADPALETDRLREHLLAYLPANIVPSVFVRLDALPLTLNGKVDRRALPPPEKERPKKTPYAAPRTPTEESLALIWGELLGIERVGIDDDFFELGGHSLLATQLMSRLREAWQVELALGVLFENPTVAKLAVAVAQNRAADTDEDDISELLSELEQLSDEDTATILADQAK